MDQFVVNIIHRPEMVPEYAEKVTGQGKTEDIGRKALLTESLDIFKIQQQCAHENGLKTTIQKTYASLFNDEAVALAKEHHEKFGDEIALSLLGLPCEQFREKYKTKDFCIWMFSMEDKKAIVRDVFGKFYERFGFYPESTGSYYMDADLITNYIRRDRIAKDVKWVTSTAYGDLDITINLSKPEKNPKAIAAAKNAPQSGYPKCQLCVENEGYAGRINHPARENHRVIPITINQSDWCLQYSPYVYYNEHGGICPLKRNSLRLCHVRQAVRLGQSESALYPDHRPCDVIRTAALCCREGRKAADCSGGGTLERADENPIWSVHGSAHCGLLSAERSQGKAVGQRHHQSDVRYRPGLQFRAETIQSSAG